LVVKEEKFLVVVAKSDEWRTRLAGGDERGCHQKNTALTNANGGGGGTSSAKERKGEIG